MTDETPVPAPTDETVAIAADAAEADDAVAGKPAAARRRLTPLTIGLIAASGVLVIALVAVAIVAANGLPAASDTSTPSADAPSETATPEPVKVEAPLPRLDATCDQLVPPGVRASLFGSSLSPVDDGRSGWRWPALAQIGGTSCTWSASGAGGIDLYSNGISLSLVPDAEAEFLAQYSGYPIDNYTIVDSVGAHSRLTCSAWESNFSCGADLVQSGFWAQISLNGPLSGADEDLVEARAQALLETIAGVVATAPERASYVVTPGAFDGSSLCGPTGIARTQEAWGLSVTEEVPWYWEHYGIDQVVYQRQPETGCQHVVPGDRSLGYNTLPGGAWAVDAMLARMPLDGYFGSYSQVSIPGADVALVSCNDTSCQATISYGSSHVEMRAWGDRALFEQKVAQVIASLED